MKNQNVRNAVLASLGLLALTAYILACTSFSPDDTKVLYPAFDGPSGKLGVAVYDRQTGRSETLFLPLDLGGGDTNAVNTPLLRPQWLADGRRVLVAWGSDSDLALALVPCGVRGSVKLFFNLSKNSEYGQALVSPVPVAGERAFLMESENAVLRLDLQTGARVRHEFAAEKSGLSLWPVPLDKGVFYFSQKDPAVFGRLDPDTFQQTPLATFTNKIAEGSFFAYDRQGKRIALVEDAPSGPSLLVLESGTTVFRRALAGKGEEFSFGNAVFAPNGNTLLAGYRLQNTGQTNASFGLMEIPLGDALIRKTPLISAADTSDKAAALYFQIGVSHDAKTAAVASTYLACASKDFNPADCALFFVDLRDPGRKVTKIPIPLPAERPSLK